MCPRRRTRQRGGTGGAAAPLQGLGVPGPPGWGPWGKARDEVTAPGQRRRPPGWATPAGGPWEGEKERARSGDTATRGTPSPPGPPLTFQPGAPGPGSTRWVRRVSREPGLPRGLGEGRCWKSLAVGWGSPFPAPRAAPGSDPEQGEEGERQARHAGLQRGRDAPGGHRVCRGGSRDQGKPVPTPRQPLASPHPVLTLRPPAPVGLRIGNLRHRLGR